MLDQYLGNILPDLKLKYGSIYLIDLSYYAKDGLSSQALIRAMSRTEFNSFSESFAINPIDAVRKLIDTHFYIGIEQLDSYLAGVDEYICSAISIISGFASEESLAQGVQDGRTYAQSLEAAITIYICKAFNTLTPMDVDGMTLEEQMRLVAMAEQMLGRELPYEDYLNEAKPKKSEKRQPVQVPINEEYAYSYGGQQPQSHAEIDHTLVTSDNLQEQIARSQEVFRG